MKKVIWIVVLTGALVAGCDHDKASGKSDPNSKPLGSKTYENFRAEHQEGTDATEEFFTKYSGKFLESKDDVKVNGLLEIEAQDFRIRLKLGDNIKVGGKVCSIDFEAPVQIVTTNQFGYIAWFDSSSLTQATRDCLESRFEQFNAMNDGKLVGIVFDFWSANELRISLRDAYIYFSRS